MRKNTIKNLSVALTICLGTTAGFAMERQTMDFGGDFEHPTKPNNWRFQVSEYYTTGHFNCKNGTSIGMTIDERGLYLSGNSQCIDKDQKRKMVQMVETALILQSLTRQYTRCYVGNLISELELCPCPEIKPDGFVGGTGHGTKPVLPVAKPDNSVITGGPKTLPSQNVLKQHQ